MLVLSDSIRANRERLSPEMINPSLREVSDARGIYHLLHQVQREFGQGGRIRHIDGQGQRDECLPTHSLQTRTLIRCTHCTQSSGGLSLLLHRQQTSVILIRNNPSPLSKTCTWATANTNYSATGTILPLSKIQRFLQRNSAAF